MAMDLNAFLAAALAPREQAVEVPELAAWFAEGEPAVWTVRGLSAAELGRAKEACARGLDNIRALVEAMAGDGNGDKAASIRRAFGLSTDDVPEDVSRRIEMLAAASVSPASRIPSAGIRRTVASRLWMSNSSRSTPMPPTIRRPASSPGARRDRADSR